MRELNSDEQLYVASVLKGEKWSRRIFGSLFSVISVISLFRNISDMPGEEELFSGINIVGGLMYASLIIIGLVLLISSFTAIGGAGIEKISGRFSVKFHRRNHSYYIGKIRLNVPSAWISSFVQNQEYTVEIYKGRTGITGFTPILLCVDDMPEDLAGIPLFDIKNQEKKLVSRVRKSFLVYLLAIGLPVLLLYGGFRFLTANMDKVGEIAQNNSDKIGSFIELLTTPGLPGNLIMFAFKYGFIILIVVTVIIVMIVRGRTAGKSSNNTGIDNPAGSWNRWLKEYAGFMEDEFMPMMARINMNDTSVMMEYRKIVSRQREFQGEFRQYKKLLANQDRALFIQEVKAINKRVGQK